MSESSNIDSLKNAASENNKEAIIEQSGPVFDPPVYMQRYTSVRDTLFKLPGIEKVVDFGCAEGKFVKYLKKLPFVTEIACVDVLEHALENTVRCARPTAWDYVFKRHQPLDIKIFKGSALEKDSRFKNFSAVTCIELVEHLQPQDLLPLTKNIFGFIKPKVAIFTTPNSEFNVLFPNLQGFRHWDHKFEWSRKEFKDWCQSILDDYPDYTVRFDGIGEPPPESSSLGSVSQVAIFTLKPPYNNVCDNNTECGEVYHLVDEFHYPGRSNNDAKVT
ncbi:small RNA 2'-O-methyltransferase [Parasteatoda tepidariorum]|nr:small RNA 2'-O-methyltransferase isoform X1 [Parasteatoda tepidariorum]